MTKNSVLHEAASRCLVAGVGRTLGINSALGAPLYVERAEGSRLYDVDGRNYIDLCMSHAAVFHGHGDPDIARAVRKGLDLGAIVGYETPFQRELAELIIDTVPCAERVRYQTSGTEATMLAIRIARGHTGREKIVKFVGHFHGLHDALLYNIHTGDLDSTGRVVPTAESAGVPGAVGDSLIVLPWNDLDSFESAVAEFEDEIAAVIMEPVNYTVGCILPDAEYLAAVREITERAGIVLIFDEVMSAFRMSPHCAQGYLGVTPDLCTISKAIANGVPLSVVAGKQKVMEELAPLGSVAQGGTYSGHLPGVLAGIASLEKIRAEGLYDRIGSTATRLYEGIAVLLAEYGVPCHVQGLGARFGLYFGVTGEVRRFSDLDGYDQQLANAFARACLRRGVYVQTYSLTLGHYGFSVAHTDDDITEVLNRIEAALGDLISDRTVERRSLEPSFTIYPTKSDERRLAHAVGSAEVPLRAPGSRPPG